MNKATYGNYSLEFLYQKSMEFRQYGELYQYLAASYLNVVLHSSFYIVYNRIQHSFQDIINKITQVIYYKLLVVI